MGGITDVPRYQAVHRISMQVTPRSPQVINKSQLSNHVFCWVKDQTDWLLVAALVLSMWLMCEGRPGQRDHTARHA
jgi:hypothetical protein